MKHLILCLCCLMWLSTQAGTPKPRVIVMTDGEVDDRCSMVRFLLYNNELDVEGIIQTNSCFQRRGWSRAHWLEQMLDAYDKVWPNLRVHDTGYASAQQLRSLCYVGDEDSTHVVVDGQAPSRLPGGPVLIDPSQWKDTPGSDRIVEVLRSPDPRKVYIQAWGGANTAAKAFQKLKDQYSLDYDRAISKAVVYNIWYQDAAGWYIEKNHPKVQMLVQYHFSGTWDYGTLIYSADFVKRYLHNGINPLGSLYAQDMISEGDSPAFLYCLQPGLRGFESPSNGGWGGRFYKVAGFDNVWRDTGSNDIRQWMEAAMHDFQARLDWCVSPTYAQANHHPRIKPVSNIDITATECTEVVLRADIVDTDKPNIDKLWEMRKALYEQVGLTKERFAQNVDKLIQPYRESWTQDFAAGTCSEHVDIVQTKSGEARIKLPHVTAPVNLHILLEVTDEGFPSLTSYQRFIITIVSTSHDHL